MKPHNAMPWMTVQEQLAATGTYFAHMSVGENELLQNDLKAISSGRDPSQGFAALIRYSLGAPMPTIDTIMARLAEFPIPLDHLPLRSKYGVRIFLYSPKQQQYLRAKAAKAGKKDSVFLSTPNGRNYTEVLDRHAGLVLRPNNRWPDYVVVHIEPTEPVME